MAFGLNETHREFQIFAKPVGALCNLHCRYCYYLPNQNRDSLRMPDDILETYILQHIKASTDPVIPFSWHGGEPTLFGLDGFCKIVDLQKKHCPPDRCILNGMQTNGILLDEDWCRFLSKEKIAVGLSIDGPENIHDMYRLTGSGNPTHRQVIRGYELLRKHGVQTECLCVVHSGNVRFPQEVYDFFRSIEVPYLTFLPLVEHLGKGRVSERTMEPEAWGVFLCSIFDKWMDSDIGKIKVQIFEEAARPAFGLEHTLCIFRKTCGGVPVLESDGDLYSCDHYVNPLHRLGNILETPLSMMLDGTQQQAFGRSKWETLPDKCLHCPVLEMCNGGCPKNRFVPTENGQPGFNYLCSGYKRFFSHCRPFVDTLAKLWREQD